MDSLRNQTVAPGYEILEIDHPRCRARVARHGAHVMEWQPAGEEAVLYCSPQTAFQEGKAIRGGIPLCWPWFNAHPSETGKPSHGFARTRFWQLAGATETAEGVTLRFELADSDATRELWPHAFQAVLEARLGRELEVSLTAFNRSAEPVSVSGALHSYRAIGEIRDIRIGGLESAPYTDTVGVRRECPASGEPIVFSGEIDRIYHHSGTVVIGDGARRLRVEKTGSPSTVIWNPWEEKARALADLPDDDYRKFVCVEAAIANDRAVVLAPGESHVLATRISIDPAT